MAVTTIARARGGYHKPFRSSEMIRDIVKEKGVTHLQEISSELRRGIASITRRRGQKKLHLPNRETVAVYIYMARRLGLIEYTGTEGTAHRKDGSEAPDLSNILYLRMVPGQENSSAWSDLFGVGARPGVRVEVPEEAVEEAVEVPEVPAEEVPEEEEEEIPGMLKALYEEPGEATTPPVREIRLRREPLRLDVATELKAICVEIGNLLPLVELLPESVLELCDLMNKLKTQVEKLAAREPDNPEVLAVKNALGGALSTLEPGCLGAEIYLDEVDEVRELLEGVCR